VKGGESKNPITKDLGASLGSWAHRPYRASGPLGPHRTLQALYHHLGWKVGGGRGTGWCVVNRNLFFMTRDHKEVCGPVNWMSSGHNYFLFDRNS